VDTLWFSRLWIDVAGLEYFIGGSYGLQKRQKERKVICFFLVCWSGYFLE
jgi:hypothetical protein